MSAVTLTSRVGRSGRVQSVESMFDVPPSGESVTVISHSEMGRVTERPWNVGLIVGPSGAGKTTVAASLFPDELGRRVEWTDEALIDNFDAALEMSDITGWLTAVGLASVPAWLRPFAHLSNGEQFRAGLARRLAETKPGEVIVLDEFTSVVDRQVAKVASHATQKAVRRAGMQFVAVSCHYDIVDWLQPDWVFQPATNDFVWRSVQPRPGISVCVHRAHPKDWRLFAPHHYLSSSLKSNAHCWVAWVGDTPTAFTSCVRFPHPKTRNIMQGHRLVVLPDWQGLGLASVLEDWLGLWLYERGWRYHNSVAHPAMKRLYSRSPRWRELQAQRTNTSVGPNSGMRGRHSTVRATNIRSWEYIAPVGTRPPTRKVEPREWYKSS